MQTFHKFFLICLETASRKQGGIYSSDADDPVD
jgi:hypothetical protein